MFIIFNKQKIYSYIVAFSTVVILFAIAFITANRESTVLTSATQKELPIYNVDTAEKKVSLTMNCAW